MKKIYNAPEAELVLFAKEDVITASVAFDLNLPTIDRGDAGREWSEDSEVFKL